MLLIFWFKRWLFSIRSKLIICYSLIFKRLKRVLFITIYIISLHSFHLSIFVWCIFCITFLSILLLLLGLRFIWICLIKKAAMSFNKFNRINLRVFRRNLWYWTISSLKILRRLNLFLRFISVNFGYRILLSISWFIWIFLLSVRSLSFIFTCTRCCWYHNFLRHYEI